MHPVQWLTPTRTARWATRIVGALALLVMAGVHLQRLLGAGYEQIPTINVLFWLNVGSGVLLALGILISDHPLIALGGVAVPAASIAGLLISHSSALFGFTEPSYGVAVVVALVSEAVAAVASFELLVLRVTNGRQPGQRPHITPRQSGGKSGLPTGAG
jgi:hypothetical protein